VLEIRTPILQRLHRDWDSRRCGREFPARSDFDVLDLKYIIGQLALLDVAYNPMRFHFRLHGTGIAQRVGYEMTGKDVDELPPPVVRSLVRRHFTAVVEQRMPLVEIRERPAMDDRVLASETLASPLSRDGVTIDMLIVGLVFF
jgi:hypothetical protein